MKKAYIKPLVMVVDTEPMTLLAGSGVTQQPDTWPFDPTTGGTTDELLSPELLFETSF